MRKTRRPIASPPSDRPHQIQYRVKLSDDDKWDGVEPWGDFGLPMLASIWPVSAKERTANNQVELVSTHQIRHPFFDGVLGSMQIAFGARTFEITGIINPEEMNIDLHITAKEIL